MSARKIILPSISAKTDTPKHNMKKTTELTRIKAPLMNVVWKNPMTLTANFYNPNVVMTTEMELIKYSILQTGWLQPILITKQDVIIDGFHRTTLARLNKWEVPCAILDLDEKERMMLTIRINRAKGSHIAIRMSSIITSLKELGCTDEEIMAGIGASRGEIDLMMKPDVFSAFKLEDYQYSKAWEFQEKPTAK